MYEILALEGVLAQDYAIVFYLLMICKIHHWHALIFSENEVIINIRL